MNYNINLPSWALHEGYSLEGLAGTYDDLELKKDGRFVRRFLWNEIPSIFELEEIINGTKNEEIKQGC